MPGARRTRGLACKMKKHASEFTTGSPGLTRHSPRNGFTAYTALSPVTGLCCRRRLRKIIPQTWRQRRGVRTTRLRRPLATSFVLRRRPRPPHPASTFVTIAIRPSYETGRDGPIAVSTKAQSGKFLRGGLDTNSREVPVGQISSLLHLAPLLSAEARLLAKADAGRGWHAAYAAGRV